jgi:NSS family neurotransmitter:Na+ symporter
MMLMFGFLVISYYTVVIAWSLFYTGSSLGQSWGSDPQGYFDNTVAGISSGPGSLGGISPMVLVWLLVTWGIVYLIIIKGIDRVAKVVKWTVPLPVFLLIILAFSSLSLDGADVGLEYFLNPNMAALLDPEVWLAAFGQIFFTLSLAGGVMIAYSSRLPEKADVNTNAHIISFMDVGFSFFAGMVVFATLGYMSVQSGIPLTEAVSGGPGLAFVAYPTAISLLPWGAALAGVIFFIMLFLLGIDSAFAAIEAMSLALKDAGFSYKKMAMLVSLVGLLLAIFFSTGGGYHWLAIVDHFVNEIGLVTVGILECFILGYLYTTETFADKVNETSEVKVGRWWIISIKYVTPTILVVILLAKIVTTLSHGFPDDDSYPGWALLAGGIFPIVLIIVLANFMYGRWRPSQ